MINTFIGLFKSILTCPDCGHQSLTFEPFNIVQLPIYNKPIIKGLNVYIVPLDIKDPIKTIFITYDEN